MPRGWASKVRFQNQQNAGGVHNRRKRNAPVVFLLLSILPLVLAGVLSTIHSRGLLQDQTAQQLEKIAANEVLQVNHFVEGREELIDWLIAGESFQEHMEALLASNPGSPAYEEAQEFLSQRIYNHGTDQEGFPDRMIIFRADGTAISSTGDPATNLETNLQADSISLAKLIASNQSVFTFNPATRYGQTLSLFTSRTIVDQQGNTLATLVVITSSSLPYKILESSQSILPGSAAYFYTPELTLVGQDQQGGKLRTYANSALAKKLPSLIDKQQSIAHFEYSSTNSSTTIAFSEWIPKYQVGVLLTIPLQVVFSQARILDPINLLLFGGALVLAAILIYLASTWNYSPIHQLALTAFNFTKGNYSERARIFHDDEIGLLAKSFNQMADEISKLYSTLETVVQKRAEHLSITSEAAQINSSSGSLNDALDQTVNLIAARFGYPFVIIYLLNDTGRYLDVVAASGALSDEFKKRENRLDINHVSLVSWTARYNQIKITTKDSTDGLFQPDDLLPDSDVQIAVPISKGSEVLGVLFIHSSQSDAFDNETVIILQLLAVQISSKLLNTHLAESSKGGFQEFPLIDRVIRQVTQSRSEAEATQYLSDTFTQLPFLSALISVGNDRWHVKFLTGLKNGRVEKSIPDVELPTGEAMTRLVEHRTIYIEDISQPSDFGNIFPLFRQRGCVSAVLVSVLENGQLSKVLVFGAQNTSQITPNSLQIFQNLGDVVGTALEKYHLYKKLQTYISELQIISNFSQTVSAETNLNQLFRLLHQQVNRLFGSGLEFAVAIYNSSDNLIQFPYFYEQGQLVSIPPFPLGEGLTSVLIQTRKPLLLPNAQAVLSRSGKVIGREPKSWMGIPLVYASTVVGAIIIQDLDREYRFTEDDVNLFDTLAPQIAIAIRNAELFASIQDLLVKHRLLRQVSLAASNSTNLDEALHNAAINLLSAGAGDQISILLLNSEGSLQVRATAGHQDASQPEHRIAQGEVVHLQVVREAQAIRVDNIQADPRYNHLDPVMQSELAVPILFGDRVLGVLSLQSARIAAFTENDQDIQSALGSNLGGVIANLRLMDQIRQQAQHEHQLFEITNKIRQSVDLETILETSAREISKAVGAQRARIRITAGKTQLDSKQHRPGSNGKVAGVEEHL